MNRRRLLKLIPAILAAPLALLGWKAKPDPEVKDLGNGWTRTITHVDGDEAFDLETGWTIRIEREKQHGI